MLHRGWVALVAVVFIGAMLGTAAADDKTGNQQRADELFEAGRALLAEGDQNAAAACAKFEEAIKLDPVAPGTMLNLGLCNEKLKKYKTALYWFRKAQARAAETNLPDYENAAKEHTVTLKRDLVATIKITFATPPPEGTKVKIDGEEVAAADFLAAEVDPGDHVLTVTAPGKKNLTQQFTVEGRGGQTIQLELVEGDNFEIVDRGATRRKIALVVAGGGVALMGVAGLLSYFAGQEYKKCADNGMLRLNMNGTVVSSCPESEPQAAVDYANKYQQRAQWVGTGLFIGGVVAVGVAGFLYFTAPDKERVERTVFTPVVSPTDVGFAVSRSF
jgi:tetratricopeptide (TPR) repeat protein